MLPNQNKEIEKIIKLRKILVIRSSAMGDVAMTAPVVSAVLERYDDVSIVMLTRDFYAPFFEPNERFTIHDIQLNGQHNGVRGVYKIFKELKAEHDFDFIVDLNDKLYSKLLRHYFSLIGVKSTHIDKGRREKKRLIRKNDKVLSQVRHSIMRYADVFAEAGLPIEYSRIKARDRKEHTIPEIFGAKEGLWIGFAPFAQHGGKVLPVQTARQTIALLEQRYPQAKVFIFGGGAAESEIATALEAEFTNCISAVGKIKLSQEMDLIANLDLMVSMDSSAMHIASLLGIRVVSVWGATHPYAGFLGMGQREQDVVQIEDLECRPCSVYGHKPCLRGDYACLNRITAQMIVDKILNALQDGKKL